MHYYLSAILSLSLLACTVEPEPTAGDYYQSIGELACEQATMCGLDDPQACAERFLSDACAAPGLVPCDSVVAVPAGPWALCEGALRMRSCPDADRGFVPEACTDIAALFPGASR